MDVDVAMATALALVALDTVAIAHAAMEDSGLLASTEKIYL